MADLRELARLLGRHPAHVLEVGTADERALAGAREHEAADVAVLAELTDARLELG